MTTVAERLAERLAARQVRRMFGVPGGDCNLDVIDAAARAGIEFVLARTETAAGIMAAVTAELTGAPGIVMTTRGPGVTNAANGIAYADLDRAPLMLIADAYEPELAPISHQRLDQAGVLRPMLRGAARLDERDPGGTIDALLDRALGDPPGPVYLEITGAVVRAEAPATRAPVPARPAPAAFEDAAVRQARQLLARARRPAIIAGLQACEPSAAAALRRLVAAWGCAVFTTYKAKGVASDRDPHTIGHYIGGASEAPALEQADLLLLYGFDPVEHPPGRWRYTAPVIELTRHAFDPHVLTPAVSLVGDLAAAAAALESAVEGTEWDMAHLVQLRAALRARAETADGPAIGPRGLVEAAMRAAPPHSRVTVDSGAHMLPVLHLWRTEAPRGLLMSRGLATMGFALPGAIASALAEPDTRTIAFTGDGGLMMCAGELGTAVQNRCNLAVVVFNDSSLTLIGAKQRRRQFPNAGVDFAPANFAAIAEGFGCPAYRVETRDQLAPALGAAFAAHGPALVDVVVDPQPYHEHIISVRG